MIQLIDGTVFTTLFEHNGSVGMFRTRYKTEHPKIKHKNDSYWIEDKYVKYIR